MIVVLFDRNFDVELVSILEKLRPIDRFVKLYRRVASQLLGDVFDQPTIRNVPIRLGVVISRHDSQLAIAIANALQQSHEPRPVVRQRHRIRVLAEHQAVALSQAINRLRIVRLKRHLAQQDTARTAGRYSCAPNARSASADRAPSRSKTSDTDRLPPPCTCTAAFRRSCRSPSCRAQAACTRPFVRRESPFAAATPSCSHGNDCANTTHDKTNFRIVWISTDSAERLSLH